MITTMIVISLLSAGPCTLSGKVDLTHDGKKVDPTGKVAIYVEEEIPSEAERAPVTHFILQDDFKFKPDVLVVAEGDYVQFKNVDKDEHGVFSREKGTTFRLEPSREGNTGNPVPFKHAGAVRIQCNIHSKMRADVLVVKNRYFTVAQKDGSWKIPDLPAGKYTVVAWERNRNQVSQPQKMCTGDLPVKTLVLEENVESRVLDSNGRVANSNYRIPGPRPKRER
jgi:plastocyanin